MRDDPAHRRDKLEALRRQGIQPYGGSFPKREPLQSLLTHFAEGAAVATAGRLSAKRAHGALAFADLRDASGKVQICVRRERLGEPTYQLFESLDLGDIVGVTGTWFATKTGELTIEVETLTLLAKALRPLPEKWHGLKDVEIRYRQRYLDLIANESVRQVFVQRARLLASLRRTLEADGFLEVETPMMHAIPGGAVGEPFMTHHQALDTDLYLRLAPELYLKRLVVGGFEKVFEVNRSFRNEGLSTKHNPEFTMLEAYCAYEDYLSMMALVKELIIEAAKATLGRLQWTFQGRAIDLAKEWEVVSFSELLKARYDVNPEESLEAMQYKLQHPKADFPPVELKAQTRSQFLRVIEQVAEPRERDVPVFVTDYWTELSPLAKSHPLRPWIAERFELFIGGMEIANAYSELNDPLEQRRRLEAQLAGERSEVRGERKSHTSHLTPHTSKEIDEGFLEALEYGMPPAGGLGVGIDRLAMLLLNQPSIKDVILFPLLKPEAPDPGGRG